MPYPDDFPSSHDLLLEFDCKKCGKHWEAEARSDFGMIDLIDEEDGRCPNCSEWAE